MLKSSPFPGFLKRILFGVLCLCFFVGGSFAVPGRANAAQRRRASVTIVNRSDYDIHHLYLSPTDHEDWGPDQLGKNVITHGGKFTLNNIPCDEYDIRLVDDEGDECVVSDVVFCKDESGWVITNRDLEKCTGWSKPGGSSSQSSGPRKSLPTRNKLPIPANWITMVDRVKGYEFQVPAGTSKHSDTVDGVDVYFAQTPKPSEIGILVIAFKDKTLTREDLFLVARKTLEGLGETNIRVGEAVELSPDYALAEGTSVGSDKVKGRFKILVATDRTDNYIMIIGADANRFEANEQIIDEIWGSFTMYSGGASGDS